MEASIVSTLEPLKTGNLEVRNKVETKCYWIKELV